MNAPQAAVEMSLYAIDHLITSGKLVGHPDEKEFYRYRAYLDQQYRTFPDRTTSAHGSESPTHEQGLKAEELIDTDEAAKILACSTRWIRTIHQDLDGINHGGRWFFNRQTVADYAEAKNTKGTQPCPSPTSNPR
ncbi:helix-turn-helix domain-containing protein [Mycolicibacterium sp. BiH015]|uniref:helix-turn-helix domain-containing protein n=1 Tax=Mycolicibacterium sp. BiH015 TaxID=3018808 RepID=UPI0022E38D71|nr:helix-turn-helix domain-containing protein [Mycolicibacterium sp. BiH015]MDA2891265.1 helix-turn-helix domain-containing protein [Mycolicibacterium sp. BiH015]